MSARWHLQFGVTLAQLDFNFGSTYTQIIQYNSVLVCAEVGPNVMQLGPVCVQIDSNS